MNKKVLVPLAQQDRVAAMILYVEKVTRPGMNVVFLMRYPVDGIKRQTKEPDTETDSEVKELLDHYSWDANVSRAKAEIAPAVRALRGKGVEVTVEVCAGSLKRAIREHAINGDVHLIMTRAGIAQRIAEGKKGISPIIELTEPSGVGLRPCLGLFVLHQRV